jgi:hypothetical protein
MPLLKPYVSVNDTGRTVYPVRYLKDRSNQTEIIDFLNREAHPHANANAAGGAYELIGVNRLNGVRNWVAPASVIYVYADNGDIGWISQPLFDIYFKPAPPDPTITTNTANNYITTAPKETVTHTPVAIPAQSDYSTNLTSVYDALAILRVAAREQDFEFAAKELMELLSSAFNEGFDFGMETAETNPYTDWEK